MNNKQYLTRENLDEAKKINFERKSESLQRAAQNNARRTNQINARIYNTQ